MQEVDRGSRNPASHEHQKNERNWLNMYQKIKSAADVVRVRYRCSEAQAATGSSMELTLG